VTELLVAVTLAMIIGGAALALALASRDMYETDLARTRVNQNLRSAMDFLGIDIRQTGERLPAGFPALLLTDGASGAPDTLAVRRNLVSAVMPLCQSIAVGSSAAQIYVAQGTTPPQGCAPVPDDNADGFPDNMGVWRQYRLARGGEVSAYLYNPVNNSGQFFRYDNEDGTNLFLHKADSDTWQFDFPVGDMCRIYILEERSYGLSGELLQITFNGDTANPVNIVDHVSDFQAFARLNDSSIVQSFAATDDWLDLRAIGVTVQGQAEHGDAVIDRTWSSEFFPRNILSR